MSRLKAKITYPKELPITAQKDLIISTIQENQIVIVAGETGSGKTTQLPKICLEAGHGKKKIIGCTQPRRIAATSMAARVAYELGKDGPELVGHKIRFQDRTDRNTRIKFMTDGILLAEVQQSRKLGQYSTLIIDEAHERNLNIDFLLGIIKQVLKKRKDLKLIISSATIDTEKFAAHFDRAPIIEVSGRVYPVELRYRPPGYYNKIEAEDVSYLDQTIQALHELRREKHSGDVLIFMPTERDILEMVEMLKNISDKPEPTLVLPLFGRLAPAAQNRIFRPFKGQKIIVATNVAETSITVPGIRYVIDTGLARISLYNARARTTGLPVSPVSQASCEQRKGRSGRTGPGICIRLFSEDDFQNRPEFTPPEIRRSNLAEVILRMISLKLGDPATFPFIDPPLSRSIRDGYALLNELGALETTDIGQRLTARGRLMARLPLDPRISRMIIEAHDNNALRETIIIAAALTVQDPRIRPSDRKANADAVHEKFADPSSDFMSFLAIWKTYHKTLARVKTQSKIRKFCKTHFLSYQRMREWRDIHEQITRIIKEEDNFQINSRQSSYDAIHQSLLSGYLRNIGFKKTKNNYQGTQAKELTIFPGSNQYNKAGKWIMAAELVETTRLYARTVAEIKPEWIEPLAGTLCKSSYSAPRWEKKTGRVIADEKLTLFGLVLVAARKINYGRINQKTQEEARDIFIYAALVEGKLVGRYNFLRHNLDLATRLEKTEDRLRKRGILADDYTLYKFYDQKLGEKVYDRASLNRFLKKQVSDSFLMMTEDDILLKPPAREKLADFPGSITVNKIKLRLSYVFKPGSDDDGVTVTLPAELMSSISPDIFAWLVPGLLLEKITLLLKGLPKDIRKRLIPIQQTAEDILSDLEPYQGSLFQQIEQAVHKRSGVKIPRSKWRPEALPPHLLMRFKLVDANNKTRESGRSFSKLADIKLQPAEDKNLAELKNKWEKQNISPDDLDKLLDKIPLEKNNKIYGYAYPGLVAAENNTVAIRLFSSLEQSRHSSRKGLPALYCREFSSQFKTLKKECKQVFSAKHLSNWKLLEWITGQKQFSEDVLSFLLEEIFASRDGIIPDRESFNKKSAAVKQAGLFKTGREILNTVYNTLQDRRETMDYLQQMSADTALKEYQKQLEQILPADFLQTFDLQRLQAIDRYFKALRIRIERAHASPAKDQAKAALLEPHLKRLRGLKESNNPSPECPQLLDEYKQMIEEYKISLFAQEIKTAFPISEKRLNKKWQEIMNSC